MKRFRGIVSIVTGLTVAWSVQASAAGLIPDFAREFKEQVVENKVPGAAYAIIRDGKVVAVKVHGTRAVDADLPVTSATVFRLASVSKTFAADLAAILAVEGKLDLQAPIKRFVPELAFKTAGHAEKITLSHLLSQSSGITPNAYDNMLEDGWSLDKILPRFNRLEAMCVPGECYGYQNILYSLVEPAIEQAGEKPYADLVRERLLEPLDMTHASVGLEAYLSTANRAEPHVFTRRDGWSRVMVKPNYYRVAPAAGVNASIEDLAKWVVAQMGYNEDVVPAPVLETVTTKRTETSREKYRRGWRGKVTDAHYGYGWRIYDFGGREVVLHAGGVRGFRTFVSYSRETGIGFAMVMNAQTRTINSLSSYFWTKALEETEQAVGR